MISDRVMKTSEYDDCVFYKLDCSCMNDGCMTTIEMSYDKDIEEITLTFYKKLMWASYWGDLNWFQRQIKNIKAAIRILFTGQIDLEESMCIAGPGHIQSFIDALQEGRKKLIDYV